MKTRPALLTAALLGILTFADAAWAGWSVDVVQPHNGTDFTNIGVAQTVLGAPPAGSTFFIDNPAVLDYDTAFPGIPNGDQFALSASGVVSGLSGPTTVTLYENSDDGFSFKVNGSTIAGNGSGGLFEFDTPTGGSNVTSNPFTLNNGDKLTLIYFERDGGQFLHLQMNDGNGAFLGSAGSGITIVPEPSTFILGGLGLVGLFFAARRRKA